MPMDNLNQIKIISRLFYCIVLSDNKVLAAEMHKFFEQVESIINHYFKELDYDQAILEDQIKFVHHTANILNPKGNIDKTTGYFLVSIAEAVEDRDFRINLINQSLSIAIADNRIAFRESDFIRKLSILWDLEEEFERSLSLILSLSD